MKKNKVFVILILILAFGAAVLYFTQRKSTIDQDLRDFAVRDTSSIDQIFLADKVGNKLLLQRKKNYVWMVNNKFQARKDMIDNLLYTISMLDLKSPVPKAAHNSVVSRMASNAVKVEIYKDGDKEKTYYVGEPTQDQLGTYMLMEGAEVPFIMQLRGFNGYLSTRFTPVESDWQIRLVYDLRPEEIASVKVEYPREQELSFVLDAEAFSVSSLLSRQVIHPPDTAKFYTYISSFRNLQYEFNGAHIVKKDSIIKSTPENIISVKDLKGNEKMVKLFLKKHDKTNTDEPVALKYDPDRMYALVDEKEFVIVQTFVFDRITKTFPYFRPSKKKILTTEK